MISDVVAAGGSDALFSLRMDPLTHTVLGGAVAGALFGRRLGGHAIILGGVAAFLPDVDVIIPTVAPWAGDPALPWLHHRHFTHAVVAIPVIGAITALPWFAVDRFRRLKWATFGAASAGVATHGLLDALTSFGTHLWWPFTNARTAWDILPIVDPLVTGPLLAGVVVALLLAKRSVDCRWPLVAALACFVLYTAMAGWQRERAVKAQRAVAAERGDAIDRMRVTPTIGNIVLWRAIYETDGMIHADAFRVVPLPRFAGGGVFVKHGESHPRLDVRTLPIERSDQRERLEYVLAEFDAFADGWVGLVGPGDRPVDSPPFLVGDLRYSSDTAGMAPLWGLWVNPPDSIDPVQWTGIGRRQPEADADGDAGGSIGPPARGEAVRALFSEIFRPGDAWQRVQSAAERESDQR